MCFGNSSTTSTSTKTPSPWVTSAAKSNINTAQGIQNQGFASYNNPTVASFSPQQTSSFGLGTDVANGAAPAIGNTGNWLNDYANAGPGSVSPSTIASRMSPYMSQYVQQALQPQMEAQDQQFAGQNKSFDSASTGSGAFGDSSYNLGRTNLTNQQNIGRTGLVADAYQRAFDTAIGAGAQDVSNDINAQTTNANLRETQLGREATGANAAFGMGVGSTNLTNSLGGQQTAADQARLNSQYNEFLRQQYQDPKFRSDMMNSAINTGANASPVTTTNTAPNNAGYGLVGSALGAVGTVGGAMLGGPVGAAIGGSLGSMVGNGISGGGEAGANGVSMYGPGSGYADGGRPPVGKPVLVGERGPEAFIPDGGLSGALNPYGMQHFADGGDYPVDEPFIVGENGPEVIQMDQPGTVIPNEAMSGGNNNLEDAHKELNLSPQERALYQRHLSNLNGPGGVDNPDGKRSSLMRVNFDHEGKSYNVPSVYDGKILPPKEAVDRAFQEGVDKFPSYGSQDEADARYQRMHDFMEKDTNEYEQRRPSPPMAGGGLAEQLGAPAQAQAPAPAPDQAPSAPTDDISAEPPLFLKSGTAAPPQPPQQPEQPQPAPTRMHRGREVADWSQRDPEAAYQSSLEQVTKNPARTALGIASIPTRVTGDIITSALDNATDGKAQRGLLPLNSPKPKPETKGVQYPNSQSVFDLISPNSAAAAESHDPRPVQEIPEPTAKESSEITRIGGLITAKNAQLEKKIKASKYSNPSKDPDVMSIQGSLTTLQADLARVEGPGSPLGARRTAAIDAHKTELSAWNDRQANIITSKTNAEKPYAEKYPDRQSWLQENMPKISAGTGLAFGLLGKGKLAMPALKAGAAGAVEGAGTAAWPTLQDTEFLPPGGNWKDAAGRVFNGDESSKDFWKRVGTGAASHALIAGGASGAGSAVRDLGGQMVEGTKHIRWPKPGAAETPPNSVFAPPAGAPASAAKTASAPTPKTKGKPEPIDLPDGSKLTKWTYDDGRKPLYHLDKKRISEEEAQKLMTPPTRAPRARSPIQAVQ